MRSKKEQIMDRALYYKELKGSLSVLVKEFWINESDMNIVLNNWWDKAMELSRTFAFEYKWYVVFVMIWWWFIKLTALLDWKDVKRFSHSYEKFSQSEIVNKTSSLLIAYIKENARTNVQPEPTKDSSWPELKWNSSPKPKWSTGREKVSKN